MSQVLVRNGLASNGESRFGARRRCHTIPRCGANGVVATACVPKTCVRRPGESQRLRRARRIYTSLGPNGRRSPLPLHPSSFRLHPFSPCGPRAMRPRRAGPRALIEIRIVKEQCRLSLRERCGLVSPFAPRKMRGFRGAKGKVSTVIYARPRLIFQSDFVSPCHEPRCRPAMVCSTPSTAVTSRPDRQGNRSPACSWAVPFQPACAGGLKREDPACPRIVPLRSGTKKRPPAGIYRRNLLIHNWLRCRTRCVFVRVSDWCYFAVAGHQPDSHFFP